jgi:hypothetical protein
MTGSDDLQFDAFAVDVRELLSRTVASLYSHLVTRPTGRAVRLAIENQLQDLRRPVLSLVDLSSVSVLDFSCADEVVAKLLLAVQGDSEGGTFVLFQGVREFHREPIEAVLERHDLRAVVQVDTGPTRLMGPARAREGALWSRVEHEGRITHDRISPVLYRDPGDDEILEHLVRHRLVFRHPVRGDLHSLSALSRELGSGPPSSPGI